MSLDKESFVRIEKWVKRYEWKELKKEVSLEKRKKRKISENIRVKKKEKIVAK